MTIVGKACKTKNFGFVLPARAAQQAAIHNFDFSHVILHNSIRVVLRVGLIRDVYKHQGRAVLYVMAMADTPKPALPPPMMTTSYLSAIAPASPVIHCGDERPSSVIGSLSQMTKMFAVRYAGLSRCLRAGGAGFIEAFMCDRTIFVLCQKRMSAVDMSDDTPAACTAQKQLNI